MSGSFNCVQVALDPGYEVVLEDTFDNLMKEIRSHEFMDIHVGKFVRKWLKVSRKISNTGYKMIDTLLTSMSPTRP